MFWEKVHVANADLVGNRLLDLLAWPTGCGVDDRLVGAAKFTRKGAQVGALELQLEENPLTSLSGSLGDVMGLRATRHAT